MCWKRAMVAGDELTVADSGDVRRKGTRRFVLPLAPLLDSFLPDVHIDEAHLQSHSMHSGVVAFDGDLPNFGEV
jgi:hypothetical protein